jgi:hypothetical protein
VRWGFSRWRTPSSSISPEDKSKHAMRESVRIFTIAGAAGVWLAVVLLVLRFFGMHI